VWGLPALHDQLTGIKAVVDTLQVEAHAVTLPTTPPTGYGGGGSSLAAADVWDYNGGFFGGVSAGDYLIDAGRFAEFAGTDTYYPAAYAKYVGHHFDYSNSDTDPSSSPMPLIDPTTILTTDATIIDWLNRTVSGFTWEFLNTQIVSYSNTVISDEWWICTIDQLEFDQYKSRLAGSDLNIPPVYPGIGLVTIGDPVALTNGLALDGPMHGVFVTLSTIDPQRSFYDFGGELSYRNIGALSFYSDDSHFEFAQSLAFTDAIYVPKTMKYARGCQFRTTGIISATVTPWTITPP
jgi:hypothetical protein